MRDDDVTELIVNALTGVCTKCNGQGWVRSADLTYSCFGQSNALPVPFETDDEVMVELCETCGGTGEV